MKIQQNWADNKPKYAVIWGKSYLWVLNPETGRWRLEPILKEAPDGN